MQYANDSLAIALALLTLLVTASATADALEPELTSAEKRLLDAFAGWPLQPPADPGNEFSGQAWAEKAGERLFFDADLSSSKTISCATCHQAAKGFTDGLTTGQGIQTHVRNTQGLLDVGLQRWFGWDGGADSLWAASLRPMLSPIEMGGDVTTIAHRLRSKPYFEPALIHADLLDETATNDEEVLVLAAKTIGAYLRTLSSAATPFDRYVSALQKNDLEKQSQYPKSALRGLTLFLGESNCHVCHFGPNFSNAEFHDTGRPFFTGVGEVDPGRYAGIKRVRQDRFNLLGEYNRSDNHNDALKTETVTLGQVNFGQWRTPSLRNLTHTAPYTHDGSLPTLRAVVDAYADIDPTRLHSQGEAILRPLDLTDNEREDLVNFLKSLSAQ
ncbi:MAG: c-type cytochrome [Gammaproteobacteria bacterium]|nr:c-type cytochrome [Gammaproteobacteria bacterium]